MIFQFKQSDFGRGRGGRDAGPSPKPPEWRLGGIWPWLMAAASGGLLALAFPPGNQEWLAWIGLAPLLGAAWFGEKTGKPGGLKRFGLGYVAGLTFFLGALYWLTAVHAAGWIALSVYLGLYFGCWSWFVGALTNDRDFLRSGKNLGIAFASAACWVALEWVRGWLFTGFGWNGLGVALHKNLLYIQPAEFTGVAGLSFLVCFVNVIAAITLRRFASEIGRFRLRPHYDFTVTMALIAGVFLFGFQTLVREEPGEPIKVAAVQANIPQNQKWDAAFVESITRRYADLTVAAMALEPDLLLWPEAATPKSLFADEATFRAVVDFTRGTETAFLLGTLDFDDANDYNAVALISGGGERVDIYRKLHLVPFGEFIPFRKSFPLFALIAGDLVPADFRPGKGPKVFEVAGEPFRIAPLVCFEDTLGDLTRRFVGLGANLLVNVTNDGWFLETSGAEQHLANAVFRAVENRRPLLRSANTGVTAFIDSRGRILTALRDLDGRPFVEGVLSAAVKVPKDPPQTFYTRNGEVFAFGMIAVTLGMLVAIVARWGRRR
jgi:apolipoprotein N-acyltransferase